MIRAIVFDCFGVLTTDLWREFCASLPEGPALEEAHRLNHDYDAGKISRETFLQELHKATGHEPREVELLLDNEINKNMRLLEYIAELKKDYKIGLLSNVATNWIRDQFLNSREQSFFDAMVFSFEMGTTKPDPDIFMAMCEKLGVKPEEVVLVDDIDRYCAAARALGMHAVVYESFNQLHRELENILRENSHN